MKRSSATFDVNKGTNEENEVRLKQIQYSGPSFIYLPNNITENIILRLSIKRIVVCKCVCKTWYDIISDPDFAELHLGRARVTPLLRTSGVTFLSRMLYLVQPERAADFESKLYRCFHNYPFHKCRLCRVRVKLDTKLRLPLRNFENILDDKDGGHSMLNDEGGGERDKCIKLKMKDHNYRVVNSCNGMLCLSKPSDNDPVIVCNPITGEFINLPEVRTVKHPKVFFPEFRCIACGFGFSFTTKQYKVIRMFVNFGNDIRKRKVVAEVHILGTKSWKDVEWNHPTIYNLFPTNFNGCLYWLSEGAVTSFDIDKECFGSVSLPPLKTNAPYSNVGMGVLGSEVCITEVDVNDVHFWAMKDCDGQKGWYKLFSFFQFSSFQSWPHGSLQPIMYLNDGAVMMFNSRTNGLIYKDPRKIGYKYLKVRGTESQMEAISYIPSFVSLKHILAGHDVQVLNINSRCGELKLHNEAKAVSLVQENP